MVAGGVGSSGPGHRSFAGALCPMGLQDAAGAVWAAASGVSGAGCVAMSRRHPDREHPFVATFVATFVGPRTLRLSLRRRRRQRGNMQRGTLPRSRGQTGSPLLHVTELMLPPLSARTGL